MKSEHANDPILRITYTNYRGETSERRIAPMSIRFGSTDWHPEPQWLLLGHDCDKGENREYALKDFGDHAPEARTSQPDTAKIAVSRETISLALSAIRASQERDYYHNYAKAQRELELLL